MAKSAEELLIYLFDEILPKHGMNLRVKQKELSLEMLRALQENTRARHQIEPCRNRSRRGFFAAANQDVVGQQRARPLVLVEQ